MYIISAGHGEIVNGDITIEEVPLISFEDAERLDSSEPGPPLFVVEDRSKVFRKRVKLFLSKGVFFTAGLLLVMVGCVLVLTFHHEDVTEMCTLDGPVFFDNSSTVTASFTSGFTPSTMAPLNSRSTSQFEMSTTSVQFFPMVSNSVVP